MPDYRRANVPGGTYFFTVNTYRRQTFLTDADVPTALREAIGTIRQTHPFRIDAWVLLPDHLHALWTLPPDDHDFSHRWRVIKRLVTKGAQRGSTDRSGQRSVVDNATRARSGSIGFGNISFGTRTTLTSMWITSIETR